MIGIDTNIICYLTQDDPKQAAKASKFLENSCTKENPGFINQLILCEIIWVLSHGYKYPKTSIIQVIKQLLNTAELSIENPDQTWSALRDFESGRADYSDYLIACKNKQVGCKVTFTVDKKAAKHQSFELL